jgi:hypothetical protein
VTLLTVEDIWWEIENMKKEHQFVGKKKRKKKIQIPMKFRSIWPPQIIARACHALPFYALRAATPKTALWPFQR